MNKTDLLKKVKALAEHGVGGEATNAAEILERMMKKYGITEAELGEETRERHDFEYHGIELAAMPMTWYIPPRAER